MFGEGFDFPELKIAAVHDIHQSLAVTIQFTGRFTRSNPKVGDATIIVNRADDKIDVSVRELYAEGGGADWNHILTKLTEGATDNQISKQTFYESFASQSPPVAIQNVTPKMSTVVYRMQQNKWQPFNICELAIADHMYGDLSVSLKENTAFFVLSLEEPVDWTDVGDLTNHNYDLYALYWDSRTNLLYINSSNNDSVHEDIAKAVGGDGVEIISGLQAPISKNIWSLPKRRVKRKHTFLGTASTVLLASQLGPLRRVGFGRGKKLRTCWNGRSGAAVLAQS
jgi:hypothetical protein